MMQRCPQPLKTDPTFVQDEISGSRAWEFDNEIVVQDTDVSGGTATEDDGAANSRSTAASSPENYLEDLARQQARRIRLWRNGLVAAILMIGAGVTTAVFVELESAEQDPNPSVEGLPGQPRTTTTTVPVAVAAAVAVGFLAAAVAFLAFDGIATRRHAVVVKEAALQSNMLASFFPANVRDRLLRQQQGSNSTKPSEENHSLLAKYLPMHLTNTDEAKPVQQQTKPIADFFTAATIM
jgi:hypothetical protein